MDEVAGENGDSWAGFFPRLGCFGPYEYIEGSNSSRNRFNRFLANEREKIKRSLVKNVFCNWVEIVVGFFFSKRKAPREM